MANEWYYTKGDQQIGPVSAADLKAAVASGDLTPTSQVWKEGMAEWKPATKIKGLLDGAPGPTKTVPGSLPPASEPSAIADKAPKPSAMSSLLSTAKSAAQLAAKQAEQTKLTTITLPAQYQPLGKHCYESQQHRAEFTDLFQKLDAVRSQLGTIATSSEGKLTPQSLSDKAKATAGKAMQAAQSQKLSMQQSLLFGALGKAVYEAHGERSGPSNLTGPIAASVARLADLDADISSLSAEGKGSWITPKRLAIAGAVVLCVSVLSAVGNLGNRRQEQTRSETGSSAEPQHPSTTTPQKGQSSSPYEQGFSEGYSAGKHHCGQYKQLPDPSGFSGPEKEAYEQQRTNYVETVFQRTLKTYDDIFKLKAAHREQVGEGDYQRCKGMLEGYRKALRECGFRL